MAYRGNSRSQTAAPPQRNPADPSQRRRREEEAGYTHVLPVAAAAFGLGLGVGIAVGLAIADQTEPATWRHRLSAERLGQNIIDSISAAMPHR